MIPKKFPALVIEWFRQNGRVLPWRIGRDPYRIWISEIMLQQTRIETVIPYYHRFLSAIPDIKSLADIPEDVLLKLWEGLGYYSRARNLKKAAQRLVSDYNGTLPEEPNQLVKLPGIGDYTAGAIASIAYGKPAPAVDGNVLRVLSRVLASERDIAQPSTKKDLTEALRAVYPMGKSAGDLTEGIMEIGERVCIPNGVPLCTVCPLREICVAQQLKVTDTIPVKSPKPERKKVKMSVFLLCCDGKYALRKRGDEGLLAGMWEFYHTSGHLSPQEARSFLEEEGFSPEDVIPCGRAKHVFTHLEWHMAGYFVPCREMREDLVWKTPETIEGEYALPGAFRYFKEKMKETF